MKLESPLDLHIGDRVQLRKPHPCGGDEWEIYRVGADIGLRCLSCNRRVLLARSLFGKQLRRLISTTSSRTEGDTPR